MVNNTKYKEVEIDLDDAKQLYDLYIIKELSKSEIAEITKCSSTSVLKKLRKAKIPRRSIAEGNKIHNRKKRQKVISEHEIYDLYVCKTLSIVQIAELKNVSKGLIWNAIFDYFEAISKVIGNSRVGDWLYQKIWLEKNTIKLIASILDVPEKTVYIVLSFLGIPTDTSARFRSATTSLSENSYQVMIGTLLAGNGIFLGSQFSIISKHKELIDFYEKLFSNDKIQIHRYNQWIKQKGSHIQHYTIITQPIDSFLDISKWKHGNKYIIPSNFILTPIIARHWHLNGSSLDYYDNKIIGIRFGIGKFVRGHRVLKQQLSLALKCNATSICKSGRNRKYKYIVIHRNTIDKFFNYIEQESPFECLEKKFPCSKLTQQRRPKRSLKRKKWQSNKYKSSYPRLNNSQYLNKKYWEEELSGAEIAKELGVSPSSVYQALKRLKIPTRDMTTVALLRSKPTSIPLDPITNEVVIGALLSDGSIRRSNNIQVESFSFGNIHKEYADFFENLFSKNNIDVQV
ncbi:MAG: hypothetical protein ACFFDT_03900 [Candidatus Hodarchaeota archaeon]